MVEQIDRLKKKNLLDFPEKYEVPSSFYADNRNRLCQNIKNETQIEQNSFIFMVGIPTISQDDQDVEFVVEQEDNFQYLFGVEEPDAYGLIDISNGRTTLFVHKIPEAYKIWMTILSAEDYKQKYQVDEVVYSENIETLIGSLNPSKMFIYDGVNSDSGLRPRQPDAKFFGQTKIDNEVLYQVLNEQRTVKNQIEIDLMAFICRISSEAHIRVMREVKQGLKEYQMAALFRFHCMERCGAIHKSYDCICATGRNSATLHYNLNQNTIGENVLILNDMGSKYKGYCSDITCTFPSNGKFTQKQKDIYEAVLEAVQSVHQNAKEGVQWDEMHLLAEKVILKHLIKLQIVKDTPIDELVEKRVGAIFFPHGLGHFLGGRVHDVGGYLKHTPERRKELGFKSLRTRRVLKEGNALTIEPGLYFMGENLELAYKNPDINQYLNKDKIDYYFEVGGVRIEDDVIITKTGVLDLTKVPRTVEQIEKCMAGENWQ